MKLNIANMVIGSASHCQSNESLTDQGTLQVLWYCLLALCEEWMQVWLGQ